MTITALWYHSILTTEKKFKQTLALYKTEGRLFRTDVSANFSHVTQKLGQISKIRPDQI